MSVRRCQREVDSYEFQEWIEDYRIRRWEHDADERTALIAREICNNNPWRSGPARKIDDFMPKAPLKPVQKEKLMRAEFARAKLNWPKPKDKGNG